MKKTIFIIAAACAMQSANVARAQKDSAQLIFKPEIHGTVRGKYEYEPEIEASRFQVRNARFSISGKVYPTVEYKAEIDLSDEGAIKMLDAYTRFSPFETAGVTVGQMRVPFTIDAHRSPHQQYFANRSFIAKQVGNVRDVGATLHFEPSPVVRIEAGAFNGTGLTEQKVWHKELSYSGKLQLLPAKGLNITMSAQSIRPESARMNLVDLGIYYRFNRFHVEGEYLFKHYKNNVFDDVHAFNGFACYDLPLPRVFEKMSFLVRYDMMTNNNSGRVDPESQTFKITDYERQRLTGGITFSIVKPFVADIRLNYENYFYRLSGKPKESEQDKFVIEVMTRF